MSKSTKRKSSEDGNAEVAPPALESGAVAAELDPDEAASEAAEAEAAFAAEEAAFAAAAAAAQAADADEEPTRDEPVAGPRAVETSSRRVDLTMLDADDAHAYLKGLIEALLFVAEAPIGLKELARAAKIDKKRTGELLDELRAEYAVRGIQIHEVAGGFCFRSSADYGDYVRGHLSQRPVRLSRPQLETLAIIAYRQPITRPEVDDIRGVDSGPVLKGLLERDLVKILGKKDEPGRPMLYGTSAGFLALFNMQSLQDLPTLKEFTELSEESRKHFEEQLGEDAPDGPVNLSRLEAVVTPSTDPTEFDDPVPSTEENPGGDELRPAEPGEEPPAEESAESSRPLEEDESERGFANVDADEADDDDDDEDDDDEDDEDDEEGGDDDDDDDDDDDEEDDEDA